MSEKVQGTILLDGLIEGRLPDDPDIEDKLRQWVKFAGRSGLNVSLEISGDSFSILPDAGPVRAAAIGADPQDVVTQIIQQLLDVFPSERRRGIFSTLRSVAYGKGEEVQVIYSVNTDGTVRAQSRVVEAVTTALPARLSTRDKVRLGIAGLVLALAVMGVTSFFVDYRSLLRELFETVQPIDPVEVEIDNSAFEEMIAVEEVKVAGEPSAILITLKRTTTYPLDNAALERLWAEAQGSVQKRLVLEAIARGYIRCEVFDTNHQYRYFTAVRVRDLREQQTVTATVPLPRKNRIGRLVLTY